MRAIVVEFSGADDAAARGVLDGAALAVLDADQVTPRPPARRPVAVRANSPPTSDDAVERPAKANPTDPAHRGRARPWVWIAGDDRPELAEDPGRGAPHVETVDPVAAVAERPVADDPLHDLDRRVGQERVDRWFEDPGHLGRRTHRIGRRSATATIGAIRKSLTGIQTVSSRPMTRHPAAAASRPTSSAASRRAVAASSRHAGSALPPGKLTSPLWWPS